MTASLPLKNTRALAALFFEGFFFVEILHFNKQNMNQEDTHTSLNKHKYICTRVKLVSIFFLQQFSFRFEQQRLPLLLLLSSLNQFVLPHLDPFVHFWVQHHNTSLWKKAFFIRPIIRWRMMTCVEKYIGYSQLNLLSPSSAWAGLSEAELVVHLRTTDAFTHKLNS